MAGAGCRSLVGLSFAKGPDQAWWYGKCRHFLMSVRLTVEHSYSEKMLESGDNQLKKKTPNKLIYYFVLSSSLLNVVQL